MYFAGCLKIYALMDRQTYRQRYYLLSCVWTCKFCDLAAMYDSLMLENI